MPFANTTSVCSVENGRALPLYPVSLLRSVLSLGVTGDPPGHASHGPFPAGAGPDLRSARVTAPLPPAADPPGSPGEPGSGRHVPPPLATNGPLFDCGERQTDAATPDQQRAPPP